MNCLYDIATGDLISMQLAPIVEIPAGTESKAIPSAQCSGAWNPENLNFDPIQKSEVTRGEFFRKIGITKLRKIMTAARTDENIETYLEYIKGLQVIKMDAQDMASGLQYLVNKGVLTQAEINEIAA